MLIEIKAHTGTEFVNPEQITHVSMMRGYALIHFTNQEMIPIDLVEWDEVKPLLVREAGVKPGSGYISTWRSSVEEPQSGFEASAEDDNTLSTDDELPF